MKEQETGSKSAPLANFEEEKEQIRGKAVRSAIGIITIVIDSVFICAWGGVQFIAHNLIAKLQFSQIDEWVLTTSQFLFAISTLIPILIYIYEDVAIIWITTRRNIKKAQEIYHSGENSRNR